MYFYLGNQLVKVESTYQAHKFFCPNAFEHGAVMSQLLGLAMQVGQVLVELKSLLALTLLGFVGFAAPKVARRPRRARRRKVMVDVI